MPKSTIDNLEVLVFGTERGMVFVVDSQAFQVMAECQISGIPVQIVTYGVFDVEYRLFVSTRNGNIFCAKRTQTVKEKPIISCKTDIVSFNILNKIVAVATTDHMLFFYSFAGKCLNSITIGESIKGLEPFRYAPKQFEGILVLLENQCHLFQIRLYTHLHLLDIIKTERSLSWMKFGQFGREEGALIVGTNDGGLFVKLFRRKASLDERVDLAAPPKPYNIKLNIPKKSKIFIDQTMRERENVNQINQVAFAEMSASSADSISTDPNHSVEIAVTVNGFGPKFRLNVKLSCTTDTTISNCQKKTPFFTRKTPLYNLWLSMVFSPSIYRFEQTLIPVSILMPGHFYTFTTLVECLEQEKVSISVWVYHVKYDLLTFLANKLWF
uniref:BBS1 domain-containing protein n=1 Tax=Angiostrongylus cantonensis TaxID=6313 RepID=A0A0K0CWM9_ANGCA